MTEVSRRGFLLSAGGAAAATGAAGRAGAQENETGGNETAGGNGADGGTGGGVPEPDFGGWFGDVPYYDGVTDRRGDAEVTVAVGGEPNNNLSFTPAAVHVDAGTTLVWEWTGQGNAHNVVHTDAEFDSGTAVAEAGTTFEYTFDEDGVYNYLCDPHETLGMKGSVVVGTDYPAVETPGDGEGPQYIPDSAKTLGIATAFVMAATLGLAYVFIKYGGSGPREE